jgi:DNA-directed RNA polymerase subunit H (RpoH/RPB5)
MQKKIFKILAQLNKWILPRISRKDITRLSKTDKLIVAYRYWITKNALD